MTGDITQLKGGLTGLRRWLQSRGFSYTNATLPLPEFQSLTDFYEPPRLVACAGDNSLAVLLFPICKFDAEQEERLCKHFRSFYPRSLCFFGTPDNLHWDIFCSPLDEKPPFRAHFDINSLTGRQERFLDCLTITEDTLTSYQNILVAFALEHDAATKAASTVREGGLQESLSWWLNIVGKYPLLAETEERRLVRLIERGDVAACETLIMSNLRLVVNIARKYQWADVPISDLIQAGNLGLMHSVKKYDCSRGFRFSTYATHWIKQSIGREIENSGRLIRYPSYLLEALHKFRGARELLENFLGRPPAPDEIAARLNVPMEKVKEWLALDEREMSSLDAPVSEGMTPLSDFLPAAEGTHPEHSLMTAVIHKEVKNAVSRLKPRERDVLQMRCGLHDVYKEPMTLEQIGSALDLSRERARQIQEEALRKLRCTEVGERLKEMVTGEIKPYVETPPIENVRTIPSIPVGRFVFIAASKPMRVNRPKVIDTYNQEAGLRASQQKLVSECDFSPGVVQALEKRLKKKARLKDVAELTEDELLSLSGIGQGKVTLILKTIAEAGLALRQEERRFVESDAKPPDSPTPLPKADFQEIFFLTDQAGHNNASLSLFFPKEVPQTLCQNCGEPVTLRPTIGGKWYRCKDCKDTRVVLA